MTWSVVVDGASWIINYLQEHPIRFASITISITVNVVTAIYWLRSKIQLSKFLAGRWQGELTLLNPPNVQDHNLSTVLVLTEHVGRECTGYFVYTFETYEGVQFKGCDKLKHYLEVPTTSLKRKWSALFFRHAHENLNQAQGLMYERQGASTPSYTWKCNITRIFSRPKMSVEIVGKSVTYSGYLEKF
jgi:hypothetical protein